MFVSSEKPRPALPQELSKATAAELFAAWGPFTANAGTYEINGKILTTHRIIAKNANGMMPQSSDSFFFKLEGRTLTLTRTSGIEGTITNPTTYTLKRLE